MNMHMILKFFLGKLMNYIRLIVGLIMQVIDDKFLIKGVIPAANKLHFSSLLK